MSTPNNLKRWGIVDNPTCSLSQKEGCCIVHILSTFNVALNQNRYTLRHNNILRHIADGIQSFINTNRVFSKGISKIHFVAESGLDREKKSRKPELGLLQ